MAIIKIPKKPQRTKARLPRGFPDRDASDIRAVEAMISKVREVYERYGFEPLETPMFEYSDALGKFLPDQNRPNAGVFSLHDDDEQWMSLRYDLTAPLARHVAENLPRLIFPYRTWRAGWVFRNEKPKPGRFRQFMQIDADSVGASGARADAEMCMMMIDAMKALGLKRYDYRIRIGHRKFLDGLMDFLEIERQEIRLAVLRALDKLDDLGWEDVKLLLGKGRRDLSGDFTPGVNLPENNINKLHKFLFLYKSAINTKFLTAEKELNKNNPRGVNVAYDRARDYVRKEKASESVIGLFLESLEEWIEIHQICCAGGYGRRGQGRSHTPSRIQIDPSVVRGLEYYTGPVYECSLLFDVPNEKGEIVRFGAVAGGGRYDGLIERFTGRTIPATGFSIGVSRLMTALKNLDRLNAEPIAGPILVTAMDRDPEALAEYQKMTQELRQAGIRAELYQGESGKFGAQLKYADRRGSPICVIQGSEEREKGVVQIKNMIEGLRMAETIADNEEWRAIRPGQFEVPRKDFAKAIKLLKRQQAKSSHD